MKKSKFIELVKAKMSQIHRNRNPSNMSSSSLQSECRTISIPNTPRTPTVPEAPMCYEVPPNTVTSKLWIQSVRHMSHIHEYHVITSLMWPSRFCNFEILNYKLGFLRRVRLLPVDDPKETTLSPTYYTLIIF